MGSNLDTHLYFSHFVLSVGWHTALRQRNEDRQCGPLLAPPCAWGPRAGACKRCGGCFGPNFSAPARVRSKDGPPAVTRLLSASRLTVAPVHCMYSQQSGQQKCYAPPNSGSAGAVVDRLCLRLSSASGRAHRKNGDLRIFYALAAISYRHAT